MTSNTLSTLFDVVTEVGTAALIVGAGCLWGWWQLRRHPEYRNDK
jgi:hypothetical protein